MSKVHDHTQFQYESTRRVVAAMEVLLSRAVPNLDQHLTAQARSIRQIQTKALRTGDLLQRMLKAMPRTRRLSFRRAKEGTLPPAR
jgi:hypothetical protein